MATPAFNYGSDVSGLVWGFMMGGAAQAVPVDARAAEDWLRAPVSNCSCTCCATRTTSS